MRTRVAIVLLCLVAAGVAVARADRAEERPFGCRSRSSRCRSGNGRAGRILPSPSRFSGSWAWTITCRAATGAFIRRPVRGYWRSQRQGDTMHSPQNCLPGAGWEPVKQSLLTIADPRNPSDHITVNRYLIQKGLTRQLVLYWYQGRGRIVGSEYWSKIYLVVDAARRNRTDAAIVRVVVPVPGPTANDEAAAEQDAIDFVNAFMPHQPD